MPLLHKVATLNHYERWAAVEAMVLVPAVRLGLWLLPYRVLRRWVERTSVRRPKAGADDQAVIAAAVWAVIAVSLRVPEATCLTQALAAKVLLARRGYATVLRVGVARDAHGGIQAHAWLDRGDQVLIGGTRDSLQEYATLSRTPEARR